MIDRRCPASIVSHHLFEPFRQLRAIFVAVAASPSMLVAPQCKSSSAAPPQASETSLLQLTFRCPIHHNILTLSRRTTAADLFGP